MNHGIRAKLLQKIFPPRYQISRILLKLLFILIILTNVIWIVRETGPKDLGSFFESGRAFLQGQNPYASSYPQIYRPLLNGEEIPSPNLNPPISVLLFVPLTWFDLEISFRIWQALSLFLFCFGLFILNKSNQRKDLLQMLCVFSIAGIWHTIELGQVYAPLFLLVVILFMACKHRKFGVVGLLIGLICGMKPNFLLLIPFFIVSRNYKVAIFALFTWLITLLLPLLIGGKIFFEEWLQATLLYEGISFPGNSTIFGFMTGLGLPYFGWITAILGITFLLVFVYQQKLPSANTLQIGLIASILFSPIGWPGYIVFLIPGFIGRDWNSIDWCIAIMLTLPILFFFAFLNALLVGKVLWSWWYGFAVFALLIREIRLSINI